MPPHPERCANRVHSHIALPKYLADRSALALQNATLYTRQLNAQAALVQSEKLVAAGRLSATMAHEINNPLEAITNLLFLIDTTPGILPDLKGYAEEALSELSCLTHIARQSLGFYREMSGTVCFDLNESIDETINVYRTRFKSREIRVERNLTVKLMICAVKEEIRQIILNLLVNALDAMPEHDILRLETVAV